MTDSGQASFYIPGVIDTFFRRSSEGVWYIDPFEIHDANAKGSWSGRYIDIKDLYSKSKNSVEDVLNQELFQAVNEAIFDESERTTMS